MNIKNIFCYILAVLIISIGAALIAYLIFGFDKESAIYQFYTMLIALPLIDYVDKHFIRKK